MNDRNGKSGGAGKGVAIGLAVAAAVAAWGLWYFAPAKKSAVEPVDSAVAPVPAGSAAPATAAGIETDELAAGETPRLWLEVGDRLTYSVHQNHAVKLSMMTEFSFGDPAEPGPAAPVMVEPKTMETRQTMTGQVRMEVLAELEPDPEGLNGARGWLVEMSMTGMTMDMSIQGGDFPDDPEARRQLANAKDKLAGEAMRSRVRAEVRESGDIGKIVALAASPEVRNQWRGILSRWQVLLPDTAEESAWEREEQDDTGIYVARYEWRSEGYPRKLLKRKLRYKRIMLAASGPSMQPAHAVEGETRIVLDAVPVSIHGHETTAISSKGKGGFHVRGDSRFSLELVGEENDPALALRGAEALAQFLQDTNVLAWAGEVDKGRPPASTPAEIEELIELLRKTVRFVGGDSPQALNIATLLIKALQAGGPELVDVIMDSLTEDFSDVTFGMVLTGVLGAAGTDAAQSGLLEIVGTEDWPNELKEMAYTSLAQVTEPVPGTEEVLIRQHEAGPEAYRDSALLLLGHAGHHLAGADDERRAAVEAYIADRLANVSAESYGRNLSVALAVLGNLGGNEVPPLVVAAAHSSDPWVRGEALMSLGRVNSEEAADLVFQGMLDEEETVRMSAVRALGEQNPSAGLEALRALLQDEPSANVRNVAVSTLVGTYWGDDEAVRSLLEQVARADPSPDVRATAEAMLGHVGSRPWGSADEESTPMPELLRP